MSLEQAAERLGWPSPSLVLEPPGAGLRVLTELARKKIQARILEMPGGAGMRIGLLANAPAEAGGQAPLAIVCEFPRTAPQATLLELHRLAWNFSHAPSLIVVEPQRLRLFTCCEPPENPIDDVLPAELPEAGFLFAEATVSAAQSALHWINLAGGELARRYPERFRREKCADQSLLENLKAVRDELCKERSGRPALPLDAIHDLLARLIFVQFLFHRCDAQGQSALDAAFLERLHREGRLQHLHADLPSVLRHHADTYALLRFLDERFNGDLFPGKDMAQEQRSEAWSAEMAQIRPTHLNYLADFVEGKLKLGSGQFALWRMYAFDAIPLEFVSSIYEAFVNKRTSTVYTPVPLVDFLLDGVLPWEGEEWDLTILDPACGSGVFLVRAFQRLVNRWRQAHPGRQPDGALLKQLLEYNLYGVDIDPAAIRVASFSLYLAMCDEIDPRRYWDEIRFPCLRNIRLIEGDFFDESLPGLNTEADVGRYDLVIGNPPWGKNSIKDSEINSGSKAASNWAKAHAWPVSYGDIGPLFLAKGTQLIKRGGWFSLLQPAGILLWNQSAPARLTRARLFTSATIEELANLSLVRFGLFSKAVGPCVIVTGRPKDNSDYASVNYIVVKPYGVMGEEYSFELSAYDVHEITVHDAVNDQLVWTTYIWGGNRDRVLINRLSRMTTVANMVERGALSKRRGINRGNKECVQPQTLNMRILEQPNFPPSTFLELNSGQLAKNTDPRTTSGDSNDLSAFELPQVLVKMGWTIKTGRFRAERVCGEPALCSDSYISLGGRIADPNVLDAAVLCFNSIFATYFLLLTSGRFANYRPAPTVEDLLQVPCPPPRSGLLDGLETYEQVDERTREAFRLSDCDWALIEDLFEYTLPFFKGGDKAVPRLPTKRGEDSELTTYTQWLMDVMQATFGRQRAWSATVFEEQMGQLPVRLIALHFPIQAEPSDDEQALSNKFRHLLTSDCVPKIKSMAQGTLADELLRLQKVLTQREGNGGFVYRRILRVYDTVEGIPTIFIAKPDEARFWTRSMAMRDADEIAADILDTGIPGGKA